jgi:antitoxin component YwqK of YwqJK toxin-antitoxin module
MDRYIVIDLIKYIITNYINYDHIIALESKFYVVNKNRIKTNIVNNFNVQIHTTNNIIVNNAENTYIDNILRISKFKFNLEHHICHYNILEILHGNYFIFKNTDKCTSILKYNLGLKYFHKNVRNDGYTNIYYHKQNKQNLHLVFKNNKYRLYNFYSNNYKVYRYYSNNHLQEVCIYADDKLHGNYYDFYNDGTLKTSKQYKDGRLDGLFCEYYNNGNKKSEYNYINNEISGASIEWHSNGFRASEKYYIHDKECGYIKTWDSNGVCTKNKFIAPLQMNDNSKCRLETKYKDTNDSSDDESQVYKVSNKKYNGKNTNHDSDDDSDDESKNYKVFNKKYNEKNINYDSDNNSDNESKNYKVSNKKYSKYK